MSCTKPIVRLEKWETYHNQKGGLSHKADYEYDVNIYDRNFGNWINEKKASKQYKKIELIPCGHCINCRLDYARDKAVEACLETKDPAYSDGECWFLTLTYDDEHVPGHTTMNEETGELFTGLSIQEKDMQDFWKRIRKAFPGKQIRYLNCMEYGERTHRPHAHALVWGLPLDQTKFKNEGNNSLGDAYYTSEWLNRKWGKGHVQIGELTFRSASYVARYTLKKTKAQYDDWWYLSQGKKKEWKSQSQSLGRWYYETHKMEIYEQDLVPIKDAKGNPQKPPKSYDRRFKEEYPELFEKVKRKRMELGKANEMMQRKHSGKTTQERRDTKRELTEQQMKDLRYLNGI